MPDDKKGMPCKSATVSAAVSLDSFEKGIVCDEPNKPLSANPDSHRDREGWEGGSESG